MRILGAAAAAALLILTGCGETAEVFEEEVQISPGRVLKVKREFHYERACELFICGRKLVEDRLSVGSLAPAQWRDSYMAKLLTVTPDGSVIIVAGHGYCGQPAHKQYVYKDGQWLTQEVSPQFFGREVNLLLPGMTNDALPPIVTLGMKEKLMHEPGLSKFVVKILQGPQGAC